MYFKLRLLLKPAVSNKTLAWNSCTDTANNGLDFLITFYTLIDYLIISFYIRPWVSGYKAVLTKVLTFSFS